MSLWWMKPGWTETCCADCGARIWPEGDPDWGLCYDCFAEQQRAREAAYPEPTTEDLCSPHDYYGNDSEGPRCYCGKRRSFEVSDEV